VKPLLRTVTPVHLGALVVLSAALIVDPTPKACAFGWVVATSPVQGSVINSAPTAVTTTFGAPPADGSQTVVGPDGKTWSTGDTTGGNNDLTISLLSGNQPNGTYSVSWTMTAIDGHILSGSWRYTLKAS
jgi:methionine-rich copper-binding protein CopC